MIPQAVLFLAGAAALFVPYHYKASGRAQRLIQVFTEAPRNLSDLLTPRALLIAGVILFGALAPLAPAVVSVLLGLLSSTRTGPPDANPHRAALILFTLCLFGCAAACHFIILFSQLTFGFGGSGRSGRETIWAIAVPALPALAGLATAVAIFHRGWATALLRACS